MSKVLDVVKQLQSNPNAKKILDSILFKGVITIGNQNDYINCIVNCYPSASSEEVNKIFEDLESLVQSGEKCSYYLLDEKDENSILAIQVTQNLWLNFYRENETN